MAPNCAVETYRVIKDEDDATLVKATPTNGNDEYPQEDYITMVYSKIQEPKSLPPEIQNIMKGLNVRLPDTCQLPPPPEWLDLQRVKNGQQFGLKYQYGIAYCQTLSLLYLFSTPE